MYHKCSAVTTISSKIRPQTEGFYHNPVNTRSNHVNQLVFGVVFFALSSTDIE